MDALLSSLWSKTHAVSKSQGISLFAFWVLEFTQLAAWLLHAGCNSTDFVSRLKT
jgi:hypothetical protein